MHAINRQSGTKQYLNLKKNNHPKNPIMMLFLSPVKLSVLYLRVIKISMIAKILLTVLLIVSLSHSEVVVLDDSNFTSFIQEHPYVFVQFYAPWCGHCKALAPEFERLGELAQGKDYVVAKVDATVATNASSQYEIEGYPTLKFLVNGFSIDYREGRTAEEFQTWIESFFATKIVSITENELKEKIGSEDFLLIQGASAEQLKVLEVANFVDTAVQYYSIAEGEHKITLYLKKDSKILDYTGELSVKVLTTWTVENSSPSLVPLDSEEHTRIVFENKERLPAFLLFKAEDLSNEAFTTLETICEENKNSFKCGYVIPTSSLYKGVARYLKISDFSVTVLVFVNYGLKEGYKFPNPNEVSKQSVSQFIEDSKNGKLQKYIDTQSDKKQKQIKYVNVNKLNAETYNSTLQNNKYVFVEYYSPNCGHCVKFAPEYEKLATKVKEEGLEYVIAAVDLVTDKEIGDWVEVQGYPTLRFFINGKSIDYNGERNAEAVLNFINSAVKTKLLNAASVEEIPRPSVAVYGVAEDSELQYLPLLFTRYPVYHIQGDHSFKVEVYGKKTEASSEKSTLQEVSDWLNDITEPLIVGVVDKTPTKRLNNALQGKYPLLVIIRRDESSAHVLNVLEEFCENKGDIVCGYAAKEDQDYESFSEWLGDGQTEKSVLVYINTNDFKKSFYEGDLSQLTAENVATFLEGVKAAESAKPEETAEPTTAQAEPETKPSAEESQQL